MHFIRRRPDGIWLWVMSSSGRLGRSSTSSWRSCPTSGCCGSLRGLRTPQADLASRRPRPAEPRRRKLRRARRPYLRRGSSARARECYDKAITPRAEDLDPIYRRGVAEVHLGDFAAAVQDLEVVAAARPEIRLHRAIALLAHAYANTGQTDGGNAFRQATQMSDAVGNVPELRHVPGVAGRPPRPVSGPNACWPAGGDAALSAAARAAVVPESQDAVEEVVIGEPCRSVAEAVRMGAWRGHAARRPSRISLRPAGAAPPPGSEPTRTRRRRAAGSNQASTERRVVEVADIDGPREGLHRPANVTRPGIVPRQVEQLLATQAVPRHGLVGDADAIVAPALDQRAEPVQEAGGPAASAATARVR